MSDIDERDIRIDTYTPAVQNGGIKITMTHIPTGLIAKGSGFSQHKTLEKVRQELQKKYDALPEMD